MEYEWLQLLCLHTRLLNQRIHLCVVYQRLSGRNCVNYFLDSLALPQSNFIFVSPSIFFIAVPLEALQASTFDHPETFQAGQGRVERQSGNDSRHLTKWHPENIFENVEGKWRWWAQERRRDIHEDSLAQARRRTQKRQKHQNIRKNAIWKGSPSLDTQLNEVTTNNNELKTYTHSFKLYYHHYEPHLCFIDLSIQGLIYFD